MRILSAKDMDVAVVSRFFMLDEANFERAGNGAGVIVYCSDAVAIMELSGLCKGAEVAGNAEETTQGASRRSPKRAR